MVDYQFYLRYGAKSKGEDGAWEVALEPVLEQPD
jgi:hypothetical protein